MALADAVSTKLSGQLELSPLNELLATIAQRQLSGALRLARGTVRARIDFAAGVPISARAPGVKRLGDLLISLGLSDPITVREAARLQAEEQGRRQLGEILISHGVLDSDRLKKAVDLQIEQALSEVSSWNRGRYEFEPISARPSHEPELGTKPANLPPVGGSTSATKRRSPGDSSSFAVKRRDPNAEAAPPSLSSLARPPLRIEMVSKDRKLLASLTQALPVATGRLLVETEAGADREEADLRLIDCRRIGRVRQDERPHLSAAPWAALVENDEQAREAYEAGALAALPPLPAAMVAALSTWAPLLPVVTGAPHRFGAGLELASNFLNADSTTVALGLMQAVSELVERAVLFLVGGRKLSSVGAFGTNSHGQLLAAVTQGLVLELAPDSSLWVPLRSGRAASLAFEALHLPRSLELLLGSPKTGQSLLIPVGGGESVVALLYVDNGELDHWINDLAPFEAAARRFGPSFETELVIGEAARTLG